MKLRAENIQKSYKGRRVVKGVSIEVKQGEIVGLLGPNGAGKTTSFYMIVGLISPNEGNVFLDEQNITKQAMYKRAQMGIGYLPQEVSVFRKMSIEDNIMAVLEMTKLTKDERKSKLESLLKEFGLTHVRKNLGQSLSGGEKRRTEIARALATNPNFILLDEPFAGVDPIAVEDIQRIVLKLKEKNIGVLITDHNVQETLSITDRTYLLFEGAILRAGTAEKLAADPQVRKVYLGQNFELKKINILEDRSDKRVDEIKSDEQKNAAYISNIINLAKKAQYRVNDSRKWTIDPELPTAAGIDELILSVDELKEYLSEYEFGKRGKEIFESLHFGPLNRYYRSVLGQAIDQFLAFIPLIGWYLLFKYKRRLRKLSYDLEDLVTSLETLKHLVEFPEMEAMI
jgi:lipopolysaccharide export system ATP-binding protein